ncbi:hypothetical protein [Nitrosomonas sp. Nm34]|uniref:hypothetical protein n=1 Tax=Nitrosomonas sp. Nm34 TaxID=1881055 RepID=UPI0008F1ADCF|nr:hypothetical protein [Nitrosomonas sp. Nm34]SFI97019.1 hypothetical protein SAMN05428978_10703 [Nitrosomonas sp. Nm34]
MHRTGSRRRGSERQAGWQAGAADSAGRPCRVPGNSRAQTGPSRVYSGALRSGCGAGHGVVHPVPARWFLDGHDGMGDDVELTLPKPNAMKWYPKTVQVVKLWQN